MDTSLLTTTTKEVYKSKIRPKEVETNRCRCVPSGSCHSYSGAGCPHNHYFNEKNVWTCIKK